MIPHPAKGRASAESQTAEPARRAGRLWAEITATVRTVSVGLLLALLLRVVFYQPFTIPSASMEPGLVEGDYIMVSKFSYGWSRASLPFSPPIFRGRIFGRGPDRGDVIVFMAGADRRTATVKRVIGLPGDRVQLSGGVVRINGATLPRKVLGGADDGDASAAVVVQEREPAGRAYLTLDRGLGHEGDDTEVFVVPAGCHFVMGDNRDNSLDSRWPSGFGVGFVPAENIVGEAQLILMSWEPGASLLKPWTWFSLQPDRRLKRVS